MKKTFKRLAALMLAVAVLLPLGSVKVSAASAKISKANATMEVDSTLQLKVKNTKADASWSSNNKAIAKVSSTGKVTAVKEGTATITATVKNAKYTCKVTVVDSNKGKKSESKKKFDAAAVAKKMKVTSEYKYSQNHSLYYYQFVVVKNTSDYDVQLSAKVKFFDEDGSIIGVANDSVSVLGADEEVCLRFSNDHDYASYEVTFSVSESRLYSPVVKNITVNTSKIDNKVIIEAANSGKKDAMFVQYQLFFFNGDELVGEDWGYIGDSDSEIKSGCTELKEVSNLNRTTFDNVKVYLSGRGKR